MGEKRGAYRVLWRNLREGDDLEYGGMDGRVILKCIFEKWEEGMDCIALAQDRDRWRAFVNSAMHGWVA